MGDGQLLLDLNIDNDHEETELDLVSWNEAHLILETSGRGEKTLMRVGGDDAVTPGPTRNRLGGLESGSSFTFGDYALPSGAIEGLKFDNLQGVSGIDLALAKTAVLAIAAASADHVGTPLPVALDGVLIAAPVVQKGINTQLIRIKIREATVPMVLGTLGKNFINE